MLLSDLIADTGAQSASSLAAVNVTGLTADSRAVQPGFLFAAFPGAARRAMLSAAETPDQMLRIVGIASAAIGVIIVWAIRG